MSDLAETNTQNFLEAPTLTVTCKEPSLMSVFDMVWPDQSNHHGTLFGGAALASLDRLALSMEAKCYAERW